MKRPYLLLFWVLPLLANAAGERPEAVLRGDRAELVVDLGGGSISAFRLLPHGLNPLSWDSWMFSPHPEDPPPLEPRSMGHFLCLDRWGSASEAEKALGMNQHGEASQVWWEVSHEMTSSSGKLNLRLRTRLPVAGLRVERSVFMNRNSTVATVHEWVTNENPIGRIYNCVQHPSIGPPFLDESTLVDCNATRGFMQDRSMPHPEDPEVHWPKALTLEGKPVDMRKLGADHQPAVVSYIVEEDLGWVTAANPARGLLIGYVWDAAEYPWLNLWRHAREGKPFARGLEFGTSGLHRPGHDLVAKGRIFDRPLFRYIDASETQEYSYTLFLLQIPEDFNGVSRVEMKADALVVTEGWGGNRRFELSLGGL